MNSTSNNKQKDQEKIDSPTSKKNLSFEQIRLIPGEIVKLSDGSQYKICIPDGRWVRMTEKRHISRLRKKLVHNYLGEKV